MAGRRQLNSPAEGSQAAFRQGSVLMWPSVLIAHQPVRRRQRRQPAICRVGNGSHRPGGGRGPEYSASARVVKERRCEVVDTALHNNLKRCSRCKAVYYCCRLHQEEHWPAHKMACVKAAPVDGAAQGVKK
jgi:hypothetical protein